MCHMFTTVPSFQLCQCCKCRFLRLTGRNFTKLSPFAAIWQRKLGSTGRATLKILRLIVLLTLLMISDKVSEKQNPSYHAGKTNHQSYLVLKKIIRNRCCCLWTWSKAPRTKKKGFEWRNNSFYLTKLEEIAKANNGHLALKRMTWADVFLTGNLKKFMSHFWVFN